MTELAMPMSRPAPGKTASIALAVAVHLVLAGFLIYGIRWQTHAPTTVAVELVSSLPEPVAAPPPAPEPPPVPKKVEPKPEPPPPPPRKPDIAVKEKPKPPPKPPPPKAVPAKAIPPKNPPPKADPLAEQLRRDTELLRRDTEQLQQKRVTAAATAELDKLKADQATAAMSRAQATWRDKIAGKIKGNIVRPPGASGNPVAIYAIALLPDGSLVGEPKLKKTTGNPALDAAIERAIRKSSPLPKPDNPSAFERILVLTFRPLED